MKKYRTIESFGIVLTTVTNGLRKYLLYKRRDSFAYLDFIRGIWTTPARAEQLLSEMTVDEQQRLLTYDFDELWNDVWTVKECRVYINSKSRSYNKYESIRSNLRDMIERNPSTVYDTDWAFPKGKKNSILEDPRDAAVRELREETRFESQPISVDSTPFIEKFRGTDKKCYSSTYYIGECREEYTVERIPVSHSIIRTDTISEEAMNLEWFTFEECCDLLTDFPYRLDVLRQIEAHLNLQ